MTATATQVVVDDIKIKLKLRADHVFLTESFNRSNLRYIVLEKKHKSQAVVEDIFTYIQDNHRGQTGIIYCFSKRSCEEVAAALREKGMDAKHFHADLIDSDKRHVLNLWQQGECKVICATIAFGMGIDKPNGTTAQYPLRLDADSP